MKVKEAIKKGIDELNRYKILDAEIKVKALMMYILNISKEKLILSYNNELKHSKKKEFVEGIKKLCENIPIEYIINKVFFYENEFYVNENVLIPRMDTEIIVYEGVKYIEKYINEKVIELKIEKNEKQEQQDTKENKNIELNILDLCTGSGIIGLSLIYKVLENLLDQKCRKKIKQTEKIDKRNEINNEISFNINLVLSDISNKALEVANKNKIYILNKLNDRYKNKLNDRYNLKKELEENKIFLNIELIHSDLFNSFYKKYLNFFDFIFSNPPYVKEKDMNNLPPDVKKEPKLALVAGEDGLDVYKKILISANKYIRNEESIMFFEIGYDQMEDLISLSKINNWKIIKKVKDLENRDRVMVLRKDKYADTRYKGK